MPQNVLITGASGGIGMATAKAFASAGYSVILGYNQHPLPAQALAARLVAKGHSAVAAQADITKENAVEAMFSFGENTFGKINVLVNNAGVAQQKLFTDITPAEWDEMFAVHVRGTFLCCKRALPAMLDKKNGVIINVASMWGQVGASCEVHYSSAKAAVIGLTKALAKEVGPSGIRVNCVAPGAIETEMMSGLSSAAKTILREETPLARLGMAEDVAQSILFLASNAASFITGQVLAPNGGMVI